MTRGEVENPVERQCNTYDKCVAKQKTDTANTAMKDAVEGID